MTIPKRPRVGAAVVILSIMVVAAALAPWIAPFDPAAQLDVVRLKNAPPSPTHWLGTDSYSRDILSRALWGARTSIGVAFLATSIATGVGAVWGGLAASFGSRLGDTLMAAVDVFRSLPRILVFLAAVVLLGSLTPVALALILGATAWTGTSRLVYVLVRELRTREFVEAAHSVGASRSRVLALHIAPHLLGPLTASGALLLADILALESGLSFIGIGVRRPGASWGNMVQDALPYLGSAWWLAAVPCVLLLMTVLSAASIADHLHAARLRER